MTDSVRVTCPKCQVSASVPAGRVGHSLRCSRCGTTFRYGKPPTRSNDESRLLTADALSLPGLAAAAEAVDWQIGDVVMGLYQVTALLGQGGMGRVYKIRHQGWHVDLGLHPHVVSCYYVRRVAGLPRVEHLGFSTQPQDEPPPPTKAHHRRGARCR